MTTTLLNKREEALLVEKVGVEFAQKVSYFADFRNNLLLKCRIPEEVLLIVKVGFDLSVQLFIRKANVVLFGYFNEYN